MEFFEPILEIAKMIWDPVDKWLRYLTNLDQNMRSLKRKVDELSNREIDINAELINAEIRHRKRRKREVDVWMNDVRRVKNDAQRIGEVALETRTFLSRARLGKLVADKLLEVTELEEKGKFSDGLLLDAPSGRRQTIPSGAIGGGATIERNIEKIWGSLTDDRVRKIGVYGMGGVGKTTIMQHINNRILEAGVFDNIIWATASQALNVARLQSEIAAAMEIDLSECAGETRRASKLFAALNRSNKYVLVLDDLWEAFPLEMVGLPQPTAINGCKLIITTRSLEVCRKMGCLPIKVELLSEQESLDLFLKTVGPQTTVSAEVLEIMKLVAQECACLPLAIIAVAGSMKGVDDIHEWRNTLNELINSTEGIYDLEIKVYARLKFSYRRLKNENLQRCFLYCALYPEDFVIPRSALIEYWIAEGLISEKSTMQAAFDKGHTILNKLENVCLLEGAMQNSQKCVRMHDLIRDMALKIAGSKFIVQAGARLTESPNEEWSDDLEMVSLMYNQIEFLSYKPPSGNKVATLLLQGNPLARIPHSFFKHIHQLLVLDLSGTLIEFLPDSTSDLQNLRALLLVNCAELKFVPLLAKLKELRKLNLEQTIRLQKLPQGIEALANLADLNLRGTSRLKQFQTDRLNQLHNLKSLQMDRSTVRAQAEILINLSKLEILSCVFSDLQEFNRFVRSPQCESLYCYNLKLGTDFEEMNHRFGKEVFIKNCQLVSRQEDQFQLPCNVETLTIVRCHDFSSLTEIHSLKNAGLLRNCCIKSCIGIESIVSSPSSVPEHFNPLGSLEHLSLLNLPNLILVFSGVFSLRSHFSNLQVLSIHSCLSLKHLFSSRLLQGITNLRRIEVYGCEQIEELFADEAQGDMNVIAEDRNRITLKNLQSLALSHLPELKSIYKGKLQSRLLRISVLNCPKLKRLPFSLSMETGRTSQRTVPNIKVIEGQEEWWESLEWDEPDARTILQPMFRRA